MAVITISRQLGSHGARIARGLARELGWKLADKATINAVIEQYGLIHLDEIYGDEAPSFWDLYTQDSVWTIEWMNKTIKTIGKQGDVVILGRGGFVVLGDYADSFDVFVKASDSVRARRIGKRDGISDEEALAKIAKDDKTRRRFTKRVYSADWADEANFDLVVDTGELSDEKAIELIITAYNEHLANLPEGPKLSEIKVDEILDEAVKIELKG